ncbi:MAG: alpha/beta fold hydrolase [Hyphomicrobiales bacterium]|nr:alpha/beta fold hydrolase [Hyphomicrobiales bacterium]MBV9908228.1 alpha/beta fold hydrolase [Hyphomicrobiales bacterium]
MAVDVVGYSRLMGEDEAGTAQAVRGHREAAAPIVSRFGGRIFKTMGDGLLLEFPSAVAAVRCAVAIQKMMAERNVESPEAKRVVYRIGVNFGDVLIEDDDILGDGVNVAARLESICEPGGVSISRLVYDQIDGRLALRFRNLGPQKLKNITKPVEVFAVDQSSKPDEAVEPERSDAAQTIKYCQAPDGVRIAYAISGSGPFLVKSGNWMNHLEYDWESPIWRHVFRGLSCGHTLVRYDARGNGMSDWDVDTLSLDAWVTDLETVVDAVGVARFPLLGISQGGPVAVAYSVRRPERVSHLILYGAFALGGKKRSQAEREMREAMATLMRLGWGADDPSFRQMFTARFIPGGTHEQADLFNELQLKTSSPEGAARYFDVVGDFDIAGLLPKVKAPTLVMHVRDDHTVPFEAGRELAAGIPGARFIALPGRNHLFLEHEPASDRFFEEISLFLKS